MSQPNSPASSDELIRVSDIEPQEIIQLSPADQLAFWEALHAPVKLTPAQVEFGRLIRGEE